MPYKINVWIPCEPENTTIYPTKAEAQAAINSLDTIQPENVYEAAECDETGEDI